MSRSRFRATALDPNDSFSFANVTVDGYSGEELNEGYQTGIVLKYGPTGATKLTLAAANGAITQNGTGLVSFNGNVHANNDVLVLGNLTVMGTTTEIDTQQMVVTDPITTLNASGSQLLSKWTGLSMRAADGYHQFGWDFDGYFAIQVGAGTLHSDAVPTRAVAFVGTSYTDGDLSVFGSHTTSGAHKVGVWPTGNLAAVNVQDALQELQADIDNLTTGSVTSANGTTATSWIIHKVDDPFSQVSPCLIGHGGNGLGNEIDGYLCTITDPTQPYRWQFKMYEDATLIDTRVDIGTLGATNALNSSLVFNAGTGAAAKQASIKLWGTADRLIYTATEHEFSGPVHATGSLLVDGYLDAYGNVALGNASSDTLYVGATIVSSLLPENNLHLLGDPTHRWIDGYFDFFVPTNYTPVGSNYSLEGHLKGIDAKLATVTSFTHGTYIFTAGEAGTDTLDTSRLIDQGLQAAVGSYSDTQFLNNVYIYLDGQLLLNDTAKRASNGAVVNDVARDTVSPNILRFSRDIKKGAIVQIVITA